MIFYGIIVRHANMNRNFTYKHKIMIIKKNENK